MTIMVRERKSHAPTLWIPVTPELRRMLAMVAELAIDLLDEFDRPAADLEEDADFEEAEATEDSDPAEEADPLEDNQDDDGWQEPDGDLGWTNDSFGAGFGATGDQTGDEDFVEPETSCGFGRGSFMSRQNRAALAASFDPRLNLRYTLDDVRMIATRAPAPFLYPGEPARPSLDAECRRLAIAATAQRRAHRRMAMRVG